MRELVHLSEIGEGCRRGVMYYITPTHGARSRQRVASRLTTVDVQTRLDLDLRGVVEK
jgi:hypothetical protein